MSVVTLGTFLLVGLPAFLTAQGQVALDGRWVSPEEAAAYRASPAREPEAASGPNWGGASTSTYSVGACEAGSRDTTLTYKATNCVRVEPIASPGTTAFGFPVHLPTGALITAVTLYYFDNDPGNPSVGFYRISGTGALSSIVAMGLPAFSGGDNTVTFTLATPHQVDNTAGSYQFLAILSNSATTGQGIYKFDVKYRLQVSPAPAVATFPNDVPTSHPFFRFVEAMAASGLTGGCGAGSYCPDQAVTRGQMAVFLSVALGLHFPN